MMALKLASLGQGASGVRLETMALKGHDHRGTHCDHPHRARGKSHIPPAIAQRLAERMGTEELTPREYDVLEQIVHGKSNKEIATELDISEATVKTHINSLLGKLGVTDRHAGGHRSHPARHSSLSNRLESRTIKVMTMNCRKSLGIAFCLGSAAGELPGLYRHRKKSWRQATDAELASLLPARAPVEEEHIETEMRTASGIVNAHGRFIAGVVLLTAGILGRRQVFGITWWCRRR